MEWNFLMEAFLNRKSWTDLQAIIALIQNSFIKQGLTLSVAESCTGGLLGAMLTSQQGSSQYFQGGGITYSNESKMKILHVLPESIRGFGAVSSEVAGEMALGVSRLLGTDIGISLTGIAGPDGGSADKPVGTVWCGLVKSGRVTTYKYAFTGDRDGIRMKAAAQALSLLAAI
jgi:nicotinamide-nucleotide amidase